MVDDTSEGQAVKVHNIRSSRRWTIIPRRLSSSHILVVALNARPQIRGLGVAFLDFQADDVWDGFEYKMTSRISILAAWIVTPDY